jgi:hypothetical protein
MNGYCRVSVRWHVLRRNCNELSGSLHATENAARVQEIPGDARDD